jgi:chromosomal replication initiator protein
MTCPPQVWDGVLRRLARELSPLALSAWITPLRAEVCEEGLRVQCPGAFHRNRVRERFLSRIEQHASEELGRAVRVVLDVYEPEAIAETPAESGARPEPSHRVPLNAARAPEHRPRTLPAREAAAAEASDAFHAELPQQRFESFVVGRGNALAREACLAFARGKQLAMSPLYLVADSGLGKSHLAVSAAHEAHAHAGTRVVYASGEQFTNELLASIRANRTAEFKRRYRRDCDLLILEDVQFLRGKRQTQLELLHTLETLAQRGARVLLTAERLPKEIPDLDPRLASRMGSGFCAEIEPPDRALRCEILRSKAAAGGIRLPAGVIDRLVDAVPGSVRDLEAALIQIVASASLLKRSIDLELVESALRKVQLRTATSGLQAERIVETVATAFQTVPAALASRTRRRDVLVPRQIAMYLCTRYSDESLQRIGQLFGRNHTSVANAVRAVERGLLERAPLRYKVEALIARLDAVAGKKPKKR